MSITRGVSETLRKLGEPIEVNIPPVEVGMYSGEMKNGVPHGKGLMIYNRDNPNGWKKYEGDFKEGIREGDGKMTYSKVGYYEGGFKNWARDGYGEYHYSNGSIYKGQWRYNVKHGSGKLINKKGAVIKEGIWKKDVFVEKKFESLETVVLVVSMHGGYDVIKEGERTIDIPSFPISSLSKELKNPVTGEIFKDSTEQPIRSLRTITAAAVGVAFYFKPELMREYTTKILLKYNEYRPWLLSKDEDEKRQEQLDNVKENVSLSLKETDKNKIVIDELSTRKAIKKKSDTEEELTERKDSFIYHSNKMYWTRTYRSDIPSQSVIRDKEFQKDEGEIEDKYDNKITVLDMPGAPDLLDDEVFPTFERKYDNRVTIHEILNYLYSQGVNNVILVDFTCSHCDFGRTSPRTLRNLRRKFGGRKKKTLKKTMILRRKKSRSV